MQAVVIEDAPPEMLTPAFVTSGEILLVHETAAVFYEDGMSIGEGAVFNFRCQFFESGRPKSGVFRFPDFPVVAAWNANLAIQAGGETGGEQKSQKVAASKHSGG